MSKVNITFCSYPDYSGNAKALYLYMKKEYKDVFNYKWVFVDNVLYNRYRNELNCVLYGSDEYERYISKTDIFFTTHVNLASEKSKTPNSFYVELGHGIGMKPGGFMTLNASVDEITWTENARLAIDYTICPSSFYSIISSAALNINVTRCLPLGFPKLDFLLLSNSKEKLSEIINKDVKCYKKILFYLPTFRKGVYRNEKVFNKQNIFNIEVYDESKLCDYLEKNNCLLCIKKHPSDDSKHSKHLSDNIVEVENTLLQESGFDLNEIISCADLLITDYSSVGIEFSFLSKPVIFLSSDSKYYSKKRGIIFDDFNFWSCNSTVENFEQLILNIDSCLYSKKNNVEFSERKKLYFGNLKDGGCKNICNFFFDNNKLSNNLSHKINYKEIINSLEEKLQEKDNTISEKENIILEKENIILNNEYRIKKLYESKIRLDEIEKSKVWKLSEKFRKIFKRK